MTIDFKVLNGDLRAGLVEVNGQLAEGYLTITDATNFNAAQSRVFSTYSQIAEHLQLDELARKALADAQSSMNKMPENMPRSLAKEEVEAGLHDLAKVQGIVAEGCDRKGLLPRPGSKVTAGDLSYKQPRSLVF